MIEKTRVAAYAVIIKDQYILLCQLAITQPWHNGEWTLPGGGMDFGEHTDDTMIREVMEETGLTVKATNLLGVDSLVQDSIDPKVPDTRYHSVRLIYQAEVLSGELANEQDGTTEKCEWHPLSTLKDLPQVSLIASGLEMLNQQ